MVYVQFFCLIAGSCALAWALLANPMRISPIASLHFMLANLSLCVAAILYSQRSDIISYINWVGAESALLIAFLCIRWGGQSLYKLKKSTRLDCIILLSSILLMLLVPPQLTYGLYIVLVSSLVSAYMFTMIAKDNYVALRRSLSVPYASLLCMPIVLVVLLFLVRCVVLIGHPNTLTLLTSSAGLSSPIVMWPYIILLLTVNIVLFGNAISRLVYKVKGMANKDQLTGLWNRHALMHKLAEVDNLWQRHNQVYSILILDLDYFKKINDNYGHIVGDLALKHIAQLLTESLRKADFICRYGGEEFLIILPCLNQESAIDVADKIQTIINGSPLHYQQQQINITTSIGCATSQPHKDFESILQQADDAMFQAKAQGRNTISASN